MLLYNQQRERKICKLNLFYPNIDLKLSGFFYCFLLPQQLAQPAFRHLKLGRSVLTPDALLSNSKLIMGLISSFCVCFCISDKATEGSNYFQG